MYAKPDNKKSYIAQGTYITNSTKNSICWPTTFVTNFTVLIPAIRNIVLRLRCVCWRWQNVRCSQSNVNLTQCQNTTFFHRHTSVLGPSVNLWILIPTITRWFMYGSLLEHTSTSSSCLLSIHRCINSLNLDTDGVDQHIFIATSTTMLTYGIVHSQLLFLIKYYFYFWLVPNPWTIKFEAIITATYKIRAYLSWATSNFLLVITFVLLPVVASTTPVSVFLVKPVSKIFPSSGSSENQLTKMAKRIHTLSAPYKRKFLI